MTGANRPSPLQNRVTPFGDIVATPERGLFMGNRGGCFHDENRALTSRRWATKQWITCLTSFKGWRRSLMQPGRYTELFFLDEAVAFAAGHRPCALCRRADFNRFSAAWSEANPNLAGPGRLRVATLDSALHAERLTPKRTKRTFEANLGSLPEGTFVTFGSTEAWLVLLGGLRRWSFGGYDALRPFDQRATTQVLTPLSVVRAFAGGYQPLVHESAAY
jgi:hypothetical protein